MTDAKLVPILDAKSGLPDKKLTDLYNEKIGLWNSLNICIRMKIPSELISKRLDEIAEEWDYWKIRQCKSYQYSEVQE